MLRFTEGVRHYESKIPVNVTTGMLTDIEMKNSWTEIKFLCLNIGPGCGGPGCGGPGCGGWVQNVICSHLFTHHSKTSNSTTASIHSTLPFWAIQCFPCMVLVQCLVQFIPDVTGNVNLKVVKFIVKLWYHNLMLHQATRCIDYYSITCHYMT